MEKRIDVHGGHRERLRQRLINEGVDNFEPHELLEFLLYYAIPRLNVNMLAHNLLNYFGSLRNVLDADITELMQVKGMGEHAARWLHLVGKCTDVCGQLEVNGFLDFSTAVRVVKNTKEMNPPQSAPCLIQVCLNRKNHLLYRRIICTSRDWGIPEILRESIRDVFSTGAQSVILVLLVEDEDPAPTEKDLQWVQDYAYALSTADSILLDLILVHGRKSYSLCRYNQIPGQEYNPKIRMMCEEYLSDLPIESENDTYPINYPRGGKT